MAVFIGKYSLDLRPYGSANPA